MIRELNQIAFLSFGLLFVAVAILLNQFVNYAYDIKAQSIGLQLFEYADYIVNGF